MTAKPKGLAKIWREIKRPFLQSFQIISYKKLKQASCIAWLDASTLCQLDCPPCYMRQSKYGAVGAGYLKFTDFKNFLNKNSYIKCIEISNNGEICLNPELPQILKYASENNVAITANTGNNFNTVSDETLEALVKYRVLSIRIALDGATPETYSQYRRKGDFNKVISNIKKLNEYKKEYDSEFPKLTWQFVLMQHNQDEVQQAKKLAAELGMDVWYKLAWDQNFKANNPQWLRDVTGLEFFTRDEYNQHGRSYTREAIHCCKSLWISPCINFDGKLMGCDCNVKYDLGANVFKDGMEKALKNKVFKFMQKVAQGKVKKPPKDWEKWCPCATCSHYLQIRDYKVYVTDEMVKQIKEEFWVDVIH